MRRIRRTFSLIAPLTLILAYPVSAQGKGGGAAKAADTKAKQGAAHGQPSVARSSAKAKLKSASQGQAKPASSPAAVKHDKVQPRSDKITGRENAAARKSIPHESSGEAKRANPAAAEPGRARSRFVRDLSFDELSPATRRFVISDRPGERLVGKAVARAYGRGLADDALLIVPVGRQLVVRNHAGDVLLDLDDDRARHLGSWKAVTVDDRVKDGAPSFCRSGAGHPVWGRQWCLDKGFGLGAESDYRWSRVVDPGPIVFREFNSGSLSRDALRAVIGDVVLDRLALHALTLGYVDPLAGVWMGEPTGPRVLLLTSGGRPVAEIVDANRDNRADNLLVALRPW